MIIITIDVCLVVPQGRTTSLIPPLALMCIAGYLIKHDIKTNIIDLKTSPYNETFDKNEIIKKIIEQIKIANPKIVGITCLSPEVKDVLYLSTLIKKELDVTIVVGGVHPTLYPNDLIYENSPVDYAVIGEGEVTMFELAENILHQQDASKTKGCAYFKDKMVLTETRPYIENLDDIPILPYELINMEFYLRPTVLMVRTVFISGMYLFTGRGCPYNCRFCAAKNIWNRKVRFRSCKSVVDEIEYLIKTYSIDGIYIFDDTFAITKDRVIEICNEIKRRKLNFVWGCETRVNTITDVMVKAMKSAGCIQIDFGVESGSQRVLDDLCKGITIDQIKTAFKICKDNKINTFANILFNTIDENEEDVKETIDLCNEIKPNICSFAIMTPFPGTDIYSKIKPLSIDEYHLFSPAPFIFNPRFKFSKHNIDLEALIHDLYKQNRAYKSLLFASLNLNYINQILKSKRKLKYVFEFGSFIKYWIPRMIRF